MQIQKKTRRTNVLAITDNAGYEGCLAGVGRYLLNTLPRIKPEEFRLTLVVFRELANLDSQLSESGVQVVHLNRGKFDVLALVDILRLIKQQKTDIIHAHQYGSANMGRLAGYLMKVPVLMHSHGPDLNYPWYQKMADRLLSGTVKRVLAVSNSTKDDCIQIRSIEPSQVTVLPNGIESCSFPVSSIECCNRQKASWGIPRDCMVIGTITRMHPEKGNWFLLEAVAKVLQQHDKVRLVLVGDGPLLNQLKARAVELGIESNTVFTGFQSDVGALLSLFDIAVIASLHEGHCQAMLEAMASGKAVIATKVGGAEDTIVDGRDGCLVSPGNSIELSEALLKLLADEQKRAQIGIAARERCDEFSLTRHVRTLEGIYRQLEAI